MHLVQLQRATYRLLDYGVSARRVQKRIALGGCLALLVIAYIFLFPSSKRTASSVEKCVADEFFQMSLLDLHNDPIRFATSFVGNGFVGIETAIDKQIVIAARPNDTSIKAPIYTAFRPLVDITLPFASADLPYHVLDFKLGIARTVQCASLSNKCFCLNQVVYAHRTRPNLIVQEIRVSNPTTSFLHLRFNRRGNSEWDRTLSGSLPASYIKTFGDGVASKVVVGVICSSVPLNSTIKAQTEEKFRFICLVEQIAVSPSESETTARRKLLALISQNFPQNNAMSPSTVDHEHFVAWDKLNSAAFYIDHSKAPQTLNSHQINVTRHTLLSVLRAPLLEVQTKPERLSVLNQLLSKTELCYSGHSTLLTPSKLWQDWNNIQELIRTMEIWLLTLEHNGCVHILEVGANGAAQAFLLSLLAATFTHHRLEIALDPEADLHRQLHVQNLRVSGAQLALYFNLDAAYKPYVEVNVVGDSSALRLVGAVPTNLYACGAGCLESPTLLSRNVLRLPLKVTKPVTPILYIAEDRQHLTQIKDTLHVSEVIDAPAPASHKIALHKHGENNGLPTVFWAVLIFTLIAFHLFLLRLLYSEWQNSSAIPYSKFSKRFLTRK